MTTYKLSDWDLDIESYTLIGIHSTVEPYRMAYFINRYLGTQFIRSERDQDLNLKNYIARFPVYQHEDLEQNATLYLVPNTVKASIKAMASSGSLFDQEQSTEVKSILIKEFSQVDYLLKIEKDIDEYPVKKFLNKLIEIPQVISTYTLDHFKIKQPDHLIFE